MKKDGRELENYLREFRPKAVRPLQIPQGTGYIRLKALALAAALLLCIGGALRPEKRGTSRIALVQQFDTAPPIARLSSAALTRLALESDADFQAQLSAESRQVLPRLQGAQSTLAILAKEQVQR